MLQSGPDMSIPDKDRGPSQPEEFLTLYRQMETLLKEMRQGVERDWQRAQDAVADLIRTQTAAGMAPAFFRANARGKRTRSWLR